MRIVQICLYVFTLGILYFVLKICLKERIKPLPSAHPLKEIKIEKPIDPTLQFIKEKVTANEPVSAWKNLQELNKHPHFQKENLPGDPKIDRWADVTACKHTLVSAPPTVRANWIEIPGVRPFIATQAPLPQHFEAFYEMLEQNDVEDIVVLVHEKEGLHKFHPYWPTDSTELKLPNRTVRIHQLKIWPDMGVVPPEALLEFIQSIDKQLNPTKPVVVHCSAGIGRTGTFIATYAALKQTSETLTIPQIVALMRTLRKGMVQKPEQLQLVFDTVALANQSV